MILFRIFPWILLNFLRKFPVHFPFSLYGFSRSELMIKQCTIKMARLFSGGELTHRFSLTPLPPSLFLPISLSFISPLLCAVSRLQKSFSFRLHLYPIFFHRPHLHDWASHNISGLLNGLCFLSTLQKSPLFPSVLSTSFIQILYTISSSFFFFLKNRKSFSKNVFGTF